MEGEGKITFKGRRKRQKSCRKGKPGEDRAAEGPEKASGVSRRVMAGRGTEEGFWEVLCLECLAEANIK